MKSVLDVYNLTPTAANVVQYAELLHENAQRRCVRDVLTTNAEKLLLSSSGRDIASETISELEQLLDGDRKTGVLSSAESLSTLYERRTMRDAGGLPPAVATGFAELDVLLDGGLMPEGFYIIGARPGIGKTTFGLNVAENVTSRGEPVLFVSLEMSIDQLNARRVALHSTLSAFLAAAHVRLDSVSYSVSLPFGFLYERLQFA